MRGANKESEMKKLPERRGEVDNNRAGGENPIWTSAKLQGNERPRKGVIERRQGCANWLKWGLIKRIKKRKKKGPCPLGVRAKTSSADGEGVESPPGARGAPRGSKCAEVKSVLFPGWERTGCDRISYKEIEVQENRGKST